LIPVAEAAESSVLGLLAGSAVLDFLVDPSAEGSAFGSVVATAVVHWEAEVDSPFRPAIAV